MKHRCAHNGSSFAAPDLAGQLKLHARKMTAPRRAVLEVLARQAHPRSSREILAEMTLRRCDLATVYRSLHLLEKMGLVKRFDFGDGTARFELVREDDGHHHHLICTGCARVVEIEDCFPVELEQKIARGNGFKGISHKLEFFGVCPSCQEE